MFLFLRAFKKKIQTPDKENRLVIVLERQRVILYVLFSSVHCKGGIKTVVLRGEIVFSFFFNCFVYP